MPIAVKADVITDDLAQVIDAVDVGATNRRRIVDRGVDTTGVDEPVNAPVDVYEISDDLSEVVDAGGICAAYAQRIVERRIGAAAVQETMNAIGAVEVPDDLAGIVDGLRECAR